ncbi:unnamed protein product [Diamesa tonsa]
MLKIFQIYRIVSRTNSNSLGVTSLRLFSDEKKNEKNKKQDEQKVDVQKPKVAIDRLNTLLSGMSADSSSTKVNITKIGIAGRKKQTKKHQKIDSDSDSDDEKPAKDIVQAAKNVAQKLGGNRDRTEAELLSKLISHSDQSHEISKEHKSTMNLNDLIFGMKVEKIQPNSKSQPRAGVKNENFSYSDRAQNVKKSMGSQNSGRNDMRKKEFKRKPSETSPSGSVNLFGSEPLAIFKVDHLIESNDPLTTWNHLEKSELKISNPPSNYFEKMILWSEQGKVWKFPIDNEQGLETEALVDFSEHIFLEEHLEGWCPTRGPIKHFMELVCVGLSKNPYISAKEKKDHIMWFRDYFEEKKDLLSEVILMDKDLKLDQKKIVS